MPPSEKIGALFDVKPVDESGSVDVSKTEHLPPVVNLSSYRSKGPAKKAPRFRVGKVSPAPVLPKPKTVISGSGNVKNELEDFLNSETDLDVELAKFKISPAQPTAKPRYKVIQARKTVEETPAPQNPEMEAPADPEPMARPAPLVPAEAIPDLDMDKLVSEIEHSARKTPDHPVSEPSITEPSPSENKVEDFMAAAKPVSFSRPVQDFKPAKVRRKLNLRLPKLSRRLSVILLALTVGGSALAWYGLSLKKSVVAESTNAVSNLQTARADLTMLHFSSASEDFAQAYQSFSKAGDNLNFMGSALTDIIGSLPGGGSVKSANNLLKAGKDLANAGSAMTDAMDAVSKAGILLNPTGSQVAIGNVVSALQEALSISKGDIVQAKSLLASVDDSVIPAAQQASFDDFKSKLPLLEQTVNESSDYAKFFSQIMSGGSHKYLILFENSAELRPTGGFPGTYAVVSFSNGKLDDFFVDDIYNIDGQIKQDIIPPLQLQHITPTWGMRDANWYADYPTSARNIANFYKLESGQSVDGVIAVNPQLAADILKVVGPINMPKYDLTLNSDNLLTTIQDQVEYGPNRTQPKQIVKDFAPLLLQKIYSAKSDQWLAIFDDVVQNIDQKNILMFFNDLNLESFATDKGFGGQVQQVNGDYVMPVIANVKGSKADAVTDTSFKLDTQFSGQDAIHTLTITRTDHGGHEQYGFYNKQNPAYVRVLVPDGSELISVSGNDDPNFSALVDYSNKTFTRDDQLTQFETSGITDSSSGVTTYRESGKSEFGFWLITDPGKTKTVTVKYKVPKALNNDSYNLYVQKQPGLTVKDFSFDIQSPAGLKATASTPLLKQDGEGYDYSAPLTNDLPLQVNFQ